MGESCTVRLHIDNSRCNHDVTRVKVLLKRSVKGMSHASFFADEEQNVQDLIEIEDESAKVAKNLFRSVLIDIKMPITEYPSIVGKLVFVKYELQLRVKHDVWNSWGEGKSVSQ